MKLNIASDYAVLTTKKARFYYGYEEVEEQPDGEEWCFVARVGTRELKVPSSTLRDAAGVDPWNCAECLLAGIGYAIQYWGEGSVPPFQGFSA